MIIPDVGLVGGGIVGEYTLTHLDIMAGRKFHDAACKCNWPIEYWHPQKGVQLKSLPAGTSYDIPLRALHVKDRKHLWVAGKCLSADHRCAAESHVKD